MEAVTGGDGRGDHQLAHYRRMLDGDLQSDPASNAIAEEVGTLDPDVREQSDGIVGHPLVGERSINIGGVPMSLLFDGDDLPSPADTRQHLSERGADGRQTTVKQHQREAFAMDLVIHLETVNLCIAATAVLVPFIRVLGRTLCHDQFSFGCSSDSSSMPQQNGVVLYKNGSCSGRLFSRS